MTRWTHSRIPKCDDVTDNQRDSRYLALNDEPKEGVMTKNVGGIDRVLRIVIGLALLAGYAMNPGGGYSWLYLLGIVPLATGLIGWCPPYAILGFNTCSMKK